MKGPHRAATLCQMRTKALKRCEDPEHRAKLSEYAKKGWGENRDGLIAAMREGWKKRAIALGKPLPKPSWEDVARGKRNAKIAEEYLKRMGFK